jgi:hypothetical protein
MSDKPTPTFEMIRKRSNVTISSPATPKLCIRPFSFSELAGMFRFRGQSPLSHLVVLVSKPSAKRFSSSYNPDIALLSKHSHHPH